MKFAHQRAASPVEAVPSLRDQIQRAKDTTESLQIQIQLTDEMIAGLALIRDGIQRYSVRYVESLGSSEVPGPENEICEGLSMLVTNWGRRLQYEKNVLANAVAANQDVIRQAESGIVIPRV